MSIREGKVHVGAAGRATELLFALEPGDRPDWNATVAMWFLDCPGQSPAWRHYGLSIIHLREIKGVGPAHITREGATHEVILTALDPEKNPAPTGRETWSWLRPINFCGQLRLPSDEQAREVIEYLAKGTADGYLWAEPPLSGQVEPWQGQLRLLEEHVAGRHTN